MVLPRGRSGLMAASAELGQRCTAWAALHPARAAAAEMGRVLRWTSTRQQRTLRLRRLRCTSLATPEGTGLSQHTVKLLCCDDRHKAAGIWHSAKSNTFDGACLIILWIPGTDAVCARVSSIVAAYTHNHCLQVGV